MNKSRPTGLVVAAGVVLFALLLAGTWYLGRASAPDSAGQSDLSTVSEAEKTAPRPYAVDSSGISETDMTVKTTTGSQLSYFDLSNGARMGTANERYARPALSIIKLYIADYVIREGSMEDSYEALDMIANSSDAAASDLYEKYPDSITQTARHYGLQSTTAAEKWGRSLTSTYDVTVFLAALLDEDPVHPILVAMSNADAVAADGYDQDFGTAKLDGVIGTKWGWSDARDLHNSVSFGEDFVVAAGVYGSADDLSGLVKEQVTKKNIAAAEKRAKESTRPMVPPLPTVESTTATSSATKTSSSTKKSTTKKTSTSQKKKSSEPRDKKDSESKKY